MTAQKGNPCNRASFELFQQPPQSFPLVTKSFLGHQANTLQWEVSSFVGLGIFTQWEGQLFSKQLYV